MKVTIATGLYPPEIGGPATHTKLMEDWLKEAGHEVRVVAFKGSRHLPKLFRHIHYTFRLFWRVWSTQIIFAQDVLSVGLPAAIVAALTGKKLFVRVPGDYAWEQSVQRFGVTDTIDEFQIKKYNFSVELLRRLQRFVVRRATVVVTPSDYFNRLVTAWGVPSERVQTVYNGVDLNIVAHPVNKPSSLVMVTSARLVPWKGVNTVIRLIAKLPSWHLVVLGDGPELSKLKTLADELGVSNRIHFHGSVNREEVFSWCVAADVFVLNTNFESFSYQIVEAMYSGTPVITTNVGSIPELITDRQEGWLFNYNDIDGMENGVRSVLAHKADWSLITKQAKAKAQTFSVERTMKELIALMQKK